MTSLHLLVIFTASEYQGPVSNGKEHERAVGLAERSRDYFSSKRGKDLHRWSHKRWKGRVAMFYPQVNPNIWPLFAPDYVLLVFLNTHVRTPSCFGSN